MVGGEEAIKKTGRDNHHFLLATPVEDEVTKIAICSVLPIFDRKANFYGNSHFRVKYTIVFLTHKENRNVDPDPLTRTPINSMPITAFATLELILLPIKKGVLPRRLVR